MGYDLPDKEKTINHIKLLPHGHFLHDTVERQLEERMDNTNLTS